MPALVRTNFDAGVVVLRSTVLADIGVPHAFSTRHGGVSQGPFASLNLAGARSTGGPDDPTALAENRERFVRAAGVDRLPIALVRQVHGATAVPAHAVIDGMAPIDGADALVADSTRSVACMIRVADCVPILVSDERGGCVAAIHAGWRGVVAGVVSAAIDALRADCASSTRLVAAIGPCAGVERFEVGEEVADAFDAVNLAQHVHRRRDWARPHLDLFNAVMQQLIAAGVSESDIDGAPMCTIATPEDFFSHRRDRGVTGRMAAVVAPRA